MRAQDQGSRYRPAWICAAPLLACLGTPGDAQAQRCDCTRTEQACCSGWTHRAYRVVAEVDRDALRLGVRPRPAQRDAAAAATPERPAQPRPEALALGPLMPALPLTLTEVAAAERYRALGAEAEPDEAKREELFWLRSLEDLETKNAEQWLLVGVLRQRVAERARRAAQARAERCRAEGASPCPTAPGLSLQYARTAFVRAAEEGGSTRAGLEGALRAAETLIGSPRNEGMIRVFERLRRHGDPQIAERARARLAQALLLADRGDEAALHFNRLSDERLRAFRAYGQLAAALSSGPPEAGWDAALTFLALPPSLAPDAFRRSAALAAAAAAVEQGRTGRDAFATADEGGRPILHAAMAEWLFGLDRLDAAWVHARRGLAAMTPAVRSSWEARIEEARAEEASAEEASAEEASAGAISAGETPLRRAPEPPPGMLAWLGAEAVRCLREATELTRARVAWHLRIHRGATLSRPRTRSRKGAAAPLLACLRAVSAPPLSTTRSVEIDADLRFSSR